MIGRFRDKKNLRYIALFSYTILIFLYWGGKELCNNIIPIVDKILIVLSMGVLVCKVILSQYSIREYLINASLLAVGIIVFYCSKDYTLLINVLVIISLKDIAVQDVLKLCFWIGGGTIALTTALSILGKGGPLYLYQDYGRGGLELRYTFGQEHPNLYHMLISRWILTAIGAFYRKINWKHLLLFALLNCGVFYFTVSRTGLLVTMGTILLALVLKYSWIKTKPSVVKNTAILILIGVLLFSLMSTYFYNSCSLFDVLDRVLTGRLLQANRCAAMYPLSLFGTNIPKNIVFDLGIVHTLLEWGIIPFVLMFSVMLLLIKNAADNGRFEIIILILACFIYGLCEYSAFNKVFKNLSLFYVSLYVCDAIDPETQLYNH